MKNTIKKSLVTALSVAVLSVSATGIAAAATDTAVSSQAERVIMAEQAAQQEQAVKFASISGVIENIADHSEDAKRVELKDKDGQMTHFIVDNDTYLLDELVKGDRYTAYYDENLPTIMIYPPQLHALVVAADKKDRSVHADHFDKDLVSSDGSLKLLPGKDTKIVTEDGKAYEGELADKNLVAVYTASTDSLPAQATPVQITVLNHQTAEETPEVKAEMIEVRGTIKAIHSEEGKNDQMLEIELKNEGEAHLIISKDTYTNGEFKEGAEVVAFVDANKPMILIYPPRYNADVVAVVKEDSFFIADRFDNTLTNAAGTLKLNIGEDTKVISADGKAYSGSLKDRRLFVEYGASTKSIPAQTTPSLVVVLNEESAAIENKAFNIDGNVIEAPAAFINDKGTVMVPLRAIAEELDYKIGWDNDTRGITMGKAISLQIGKDAYVFAKKAPVELGTAPIIVKGNAYVPLEFFTEIAQLSDAYTNNNEIVIKK